MEDHVETLDDWRIAARRDFETHRQRLKEMRRAVEDTKDALPLGRFDAESGAPLDLAAALVSLCDLLEDEHFRPLTRRLAEASAWLDGHEQPPTYPADYVGGS